ncbi:MAG: FGGY family carbohydrate kinase [Gammaproteobacteria bacterium]
MPPCYLALDQGTHASRALLFDADGGCLFHTERPVTLQRLDDHRVQQDGDELLTTLSACLDEAADFSRRRKLQIAAAGLATQRSTTLAWDRVTGRTLSPALSWQDTRAAGEVFELCRPAEAVHKITGLYPSAHFAAGKIRWLLQQVPAVRRALRQSRLALGPLSAYLIHGLLEQQPLQIDDANAARTLLYNLHNRDWDDGLLGKFGIPRDVLPACRPVEHRYGTLTGTNVALTAVSGDQNAALYGAGQPRDDTLYVNLGSGAFVLGLLGTRPLTTSRLLNTLIYSADDQAVCHYAMEGSVNGAGSALEWAREHAGLDTGTPALEAALNCATPALFINAVGGLGSPWWRADLAPHWMEPGGSEQERLAGVLESVLFLVQANIDQLCAMRPFKHIQVSGGLAHLDGLCQRLADLSDLPVQRSRETESTARGIAWLAGGRWTVPMATDADRFAPRYDAVLQARYARFIDVLEHA